MPKQVIKAPERRYNSYMSNIYGSASKIVFILLAVTACVGFLTKLLPVDQFMILVSGAFTFYFSNKGDPNKQFAGK